MIRPIIFDSESVTAILNGTKTQTRRAINPQPSFAQVHQYQGKTLYDGENRRWCWKSHVGDIWTDANLTFSPLCPYGQPGDRLWVKERWAIDSLTPTCHKLRYADDSTRPIPAPYDGDDGEALFWAFERGRIMPFGHGHLCRVQSSLFMPRWASRLTLEITDVRVQRLQDLTFDDAIAEGMERFWDSAVGMYKVSRRYYDYPHDAFMPRWDSINGRRRKDKPDVSWNANPWVWAITFRVVGESEDSK